MNIILWQDKYMRYHMCASAQRGFAPDKLFLEIGLVILATHVKSEIFKESGIRTLGQTSLVHIML